MSDGQDPRHARGEWEHYVPPKKCVKCDHSANLHGGAYVEGSECNVQGCDCRTLILADDVEKHAVASDNKPDMVNHPSHYGKGKDDPYEVIKVLRAWGYLNNSLRFNSIKYLARAGKKGKGDQATVEDLKKSIWYIREEIKELGGNPDA